MNGSVPPGVVVNGRWRIVGYLGAGGFGEVLLADDESEMHLGQAALKVLHGAISPVERDNFVREVQKIAGLRHPNLVGYLDSGSFTNPATPGEPARPFLVTELCDGSLDDDLRRLPDSRLPLEQTVAVLTDVIAGLTHLHQRGLIHRDIKTANVLRADRTWKLADFGLMRDLTATGSYHRGGAPIGTPLYMAPELFTNAPTTSASDIFAVGVLAHVCSTGRALHTGTGSALLLNIAAGNASISPDLHPGLVELVRRTTAPDPAHRPTIEQITQLLPGTGPATVAAPAPGGISGPTVAAPGFGGVSGPVVAAPYGSPGGVSGPVVAAPYGSPGGVSGRMAAAPYGSPDGSRPPEGSRVPLLVGLVLMAAALIAGSLYLLPDSNGDEETASPADEVSTDTSLSGDDVAEAEAGPTDDVGVGVTDVESGEASGATPATWECAASPVVPVGGPGDLVVEAGGDGCPAASGSFVAEGVAVAVEYELAAGQAVVAEVSTFGSSADLVVLDPGGVSVVSSDGDGDDTLQWTAGVAGTFTLQLTKTGGGGSTYGIEMFVAG